MKRTYDPRTWGPISNRGLFGCTGVKDINGEYIYLYDIVLSPISEKSSWRQYIVIEPLLSTTGVYININEESEIVGNVYKDPELVSEVLDRKMVNKKTGVTITHNIDNEKEN